MHKMRWKHSCKDGKVQATHVVSAPNGRRLSARFIPAEFAYGICVVVWFCIVLECCARPAYGYTDPGTGLLALQLLGTTFAGVGFVVRRRIRQFIGRFVAVLTRYFRAKSL